MDLWVVNSLNAITYGFILFLIASGLTLIFGLMGILNIAHGALWMIGAYAGLWVFKATGNFLLAALAGGAAGALTAFFIERGFLRRLYKQEVDQVLLTFGIANILIYMAIWVWGSTPRMPFLSGVLSSSMSVGDISFPIYRLVVILVGLAVATGMWLFQEKTRVGAIIRAGMDDREMVQGLGVTIGLVSTVVFIIGGFIAGLAGVVGAPVLGIYPLAALDILLLAFVVVIVGGMGSVQGALLGSMVIGFVATLSSVFVPQLSMFTLYLLLIIILLFRPSGLLGRRV